VITEAIAAHQVLRLSGLRFFPIHTEAQDELVKALMAVSKDDGHAEWIVSDWLRWNRESPTPYDIYEIGTPPIEVPEL
jgi:hypothetical protein